jgi:hypothetical protein
MGGLNFFHGPSPDGVVFSGASPDIVCLEMGHATLDSLKPQLFDAGSQEAAAFHESFGDMSAILSDLQLPSLRAAILTTPTVTSPTIRASPSNSAQQSVLRAQTLSIRIACETPPIPSAMRIQAHCPRSRLRLKFRRRRIPFHASSPGAFFEALGGMLTAHAADRANPTPDELGEVSFQSTRPLANRSSAN